MHGAQVFHASRKWSHVSFASSSANPKRPSQKFEKPWLVPRTNTALLRWRLCPSVRRIQMSQWLYYGSGTKHKTWNSTWNTMYRPSTFVWFYWTIPPIQPRLKNWRLDHSLRRMWQSSGYLYINPLYYRYVFFLWKTKDVAYHHTKWAGASQQAPLIQRAGAGGNIVILKNWSFQHHLAKCINYIYQDPSIDSPLEVI